MSSIEKFTYAICSCAFAVIALCSIIAFGGEWSRNTAIFASLLACGSQFSAQGETGNSVKISVVLVYGAFAAAFLAFYWTAQGW